MEAAMIAGTSGDALDNIYDIGKVCHAKAIMPLPVSVLPRGTQIPKMHDLLEHFPTKCTALSSLTSNGGSGKVRGTV